MKKLNRRNIRKMLTQMLSEASEFGDMKTSNTYTYKDDGYTYLVMDDMWYVIKGKKKSASSTKDYISLSKNTKAMSRLDAEHPEARSPKAVKDVKNTINKTNNEKAHKNLNNYAAVEKHLSNISDRVDDVKDLGLVSAYSRNPDSVGADVKNLLRMLNKKIANIEKMVQNKDNKALAQEQDKVNMVTKSLLRKIQGLPEKNKIKSTLDNLAREIGELQNYQDVDMGTKSSGSSNVASEIKEAVFNRLKKKIILEQTSDFNVTTAGTGEKFNGELKIGDETYNVDDDYVYSSSGHQLARIDLYKQFSIGGIKYFINDGNVYDVAKGTNTVMGTFEKDETADIIFKEEPNNPIVVDPKTGEQDVAKIKYNKNTECIQKIVDPYEIHTKHDGDWGKNTQKAWEMYIKGEYTVLGKKSEYSGGERSMSTDVDGDGSTRTFKPNFDRKFKQTFPNFADSEMEALKKELLKNTSVLTKLGYQKGAKHVCQFLKDINTTSVVKDNVSDIGYSQTAVNESLSRGSLYRRRYHGRY